jgi:hypothetical protein
LPAEKNYQKEREKNEWSYVEMRAEMGEGERKNRKGNWDD